jgi:hypothetical protein
MFWASLCPSSGAYQLQLVGLFECVKMHGPTNPKLKVCVCILFLVIRHADGLYAAPYYNFICGVSGCSVFFHIILKKKAQSLERIVET